MNVNVNLFVNYINHAKYDMIWYDMMSHGMIWYDMIGYDTYDNISVWQACKIRIIFFVWYE